MGAFSRMGADLRGYYLKWGGGLFEDLRYPLIKLEFCITNASSVAR